MDREKAEDAKRKVELEIDQYKLKTASEALDKKNEEREKAERRANGQDIDRSANDKKDYPEE